MITFLMSGISYVSINLPYHFRGSDIGWHEWIEAKFFDWDSELGQLSFISFNHVRVSFSDFLELGLNLANGVVLKLFDFF